MERVQVPQSKKIEPFLVLFIVYSLQVGVGMLGFQRIIAKEAGYDSWFSILLAGIVVHILIWIIYQMLAITGGDLVSIHQYVFGKTIAKIICVPFILYFLMSGIVVLYGYLEIIQVWMFPQLNTIWICITLLLLALYIISGGFRTVTGIAYFSIILSVYLVPLFWFNIPYSDFTYLLPLLNTSLPKILAASKSMTLTLLGFETILVYYPFINNAKKSLKWAQYGVLCSIITCLLLAILTFGYYSPAQLDVVLWPTVHMWKIFRMSFIERFEYIGISAWLLLVLPNICLTIWCATRLTKRLFKIRQKNSLYFFIFLCLIPIYFLRQREDIDFITDLTAQIGFYINFVYVPILYIAILIAKRVKK